MINIIVIILLFSPSVLSRLNVGMIVVGIVWIMEEGEVAPMRMAWLVYVEPWRPATALWIVVEFCHLVRGVALFKVDFM